MRNAISSDRYILRELRRKVIVFKFNRKKIKNMKRVLFTLVACLVGISSLMAQSFSLPGYLFGRCPDYSITYDKNDAQEQKDVYICDGNKSVVRIEQL